MYLRRLILGCAGLCVFGQAAAVANVDKGEFTYRGQLKLDSVPVNDTCDLAFSLWKHADSVLPADQVGATLTFDGLGGNLGPIDVVNGLFSALLDFGPAVFVDEARWLEVAVRCPAGNGSYTILTPRERITGVPYAIHTRGIFVSEFGEIGIGTTAPEAPFHMVGNGQFRGNHIAYFESQSGASSDGIAIQLDNPSTNRNNNFITFYNGNEIVTGRIEGFDLENGDWIAPPPLPDPNLVFDPGITYNPDWLDLGALPTLIFSPGSLPSVNFTPGTLPTANFTPGTLPSLSFSGGSLPNLTFSGGSLPSINFTPGSLPSLNFNAGNLPTLAFSGGTLPSLSFNPGTLPSLNINFFTGTYSFSTGSLPSATFSTGTLPTATLNSGTLPTANFTPGSLPTLNFSPGTLPTANFTPGTLPTANFTPGTLPSLTFSGGSLPSLNFTPGTLPSVAFNRGQLPRIVDDPLTFGRFELSFDLPTEADIEALMCWASEMGVSDFLTWDPVAIAVTALREAAAAKCRDEGVTYGSKGADYAEYLPKLNPHDRFQFGQLVGIHNGKVSLKTTGAEQIMAVSRAPVVVGNVPPDGEKDNFVTVGFMGQLPVVVRGKVNYGDYIVPSGLEDGTAVAVSPARLDIEHLGKVVGRAWSESENNVYSLINVVIGLDHYEAKLILQRQRDRLELQARAMDSLTAENARLNAQMTSMNDQLTSLMTSLRNLEEHVQGQAGCPQPVASVGLNQQ